MKDLICEDSESVRSLLHYSAENWCDHFGAVVAPDDEILRWVRRLYDVGSEIIQLWFSEFWHITMPYHPVPGMKALHLAAINGHQGILSELLVSATGNIEEVDGSGRTALQWACVKGHLEIVQQLLEKGADVNAQGGLYGNALQAAAERGHIEIVQALLEKGADANAQNGQCSNALYAAAKRGYLEIVQHLLEKGADINAQGGRHGNALQAAIQEEHLEIVEQLLKNGANIIAQAQDGLYSNGNALYAPAETGYQNSSEEI